jgi:hypothetical protein
MLLIVAHYIDPYFHKQIVGLPGCVVDTSLPSNGMCPPNSVGVVRFPPVKTELRMANKVRTDHRDAGIPRVACLLDVVRTSICADTASKQVETWESIQQAFTVLRCKNSLHGEGAATHGMVQIVANVLIEQKVDGAIPLSYRGMVNDGIGFDSACTKVLRRTSNINCAGYTAQTVAAKLVTAKELLVQFCVRCSSLSSSQHP